MPPPPQPLTKAVLLAAGKGTRMKELTADLPKPMLPVAGVPVLERIVSGLKQAGVREFLLITGYREEVVRAHFGDGSRLGVSISYVRQTVQDGTGRAVELARDFVGTDPFVLSYGDILVAPESYRALARCWESGRGEACVTAQLGEDIRKGGFYIFDARFNLIELAEKPKDAEIEALRKKYGELKPWYNCAIYVFPPLIFEFTARLRKSPRGEYELTDAIRDMVRAGHTVAGLPIEGYWVDVRDPETLAKTEAFFRNAG